MNQQRTFLAERARLEARAREQMLRLQAKIKDPVKRMQAIRELVERNREKLQAIQARQRSRENENSV